MSTYSERDDFTLIVRVFDLNIKNKLIEIEESMYEQQKQQQQQQQVTLRQPSSSSSQSSGTLGQPGRVVTFIEEMNDDDNDDMNDYDDDVEWQRRRSERGGSESTLESTYSSLISTSISTNNNRTTSQLEETNRSAEKTKREDLPLERLVDESGRVVPYLQLDRLESALSNSNEATRDLFESYCDQLAALKVDRI